MAMKRQLDHGAQSRAEPLTLKYIWWSPALQWLSPAPRVLSRATVPCRPWWLSFSCHAGSMSFTLSIIIYVSLVQFYQSLVKCLSKPSVVDFQKYFLKERTTEKLIFCTSTMTQNSTPELSPTSIDSGSGLTLFKIVLKTLKIEWPCNC